MFCRHCGAQIPDGSAFCTRCGQRVADGGAAPAATAVPAPAPQPAVPPQSAPAQRKRRRGLVVALVVLAVVAVAAAVGAGLYLSGALNGVLGRASVPDVVGEKPYDALRDLRSASDAWRVTFLDESGQVLDVTDEFSYQFYEVSSVTPEPGSALSAADGGQSVVVTLAKTQRQIEREQAIQGEIDDSLSNGFKDETYVDAGCYVEFTGTTSVAVRDWYFFENGEVDDQNLAYYKDLAGELGSSVIGASYSSDGLPSALYVVVRDDASEEEARRTRERGEQLRTEMESAAHDSADALLTDLCPHIASVDTILLQGSLGSLGASGSGEVSVTYELDDTSVRITERGDFDGSTWPTKTDLDGDGRVYERTVDYLSTCTGRSVDYTIVNNRGDVLFHYSAPAGSYTFFFEG